MNVGVQPNWLNRNEMRESTIPLKIGVFLLVCEGCQERGNDEQFPKWRSKHTRKRPKSGRSWQASAARKRWS